MVKYLVIAVILLSGRLSAQSYEAQVYRQADSIIGVPFRILQGLTAICNLPVGILPTNPINPSFLEFNDPSIANRSCRIYLTNFFASLPQANGYKATLTFNGSPRSNSSGNFRRGPVGTTCLDRGGNQIDNEVTVSGIRMLSSNCLVPIQ